MEKGVTAKVVRRHWTRLYAIYAINAHKSFAKACLLLQFNEIRWIAENKFILCCAGTGLVSRVA